MTGSAGPPTRRSRTAGLGRRFRRLLRRTPVTSEPWRWGIGVGAGLVVLLIGLVDARTGPLVTFSVLYLLPIAAVAILVSPRVGYLLSTESVLLWTLADASTRELPATTLVWNGVIRWIIFLVVVFLLGALREAVEDAERAGESSRRFLADVAHQLRTPIAGLMASAEALTMEPDADRRDRLTDNLIHSTERIGRLLSGLLETARATESDDGVPRSLDVVAVVTTELAARRHAPVAITVEAPEVVLARVEPDAFREAFANVVDNALQRAGSVVEVVVEEGDDVLVWVDDDGPGVPDGAGELVFERFRRLDERGGAGLGLPIARSLMRSMGGDVQLREGRFVVVAIPA